MNNFVLPEVVVLHITGNVKHPRSEIAIAPEKVLVL